VLKHCDGHTIYAPKTFTDIGVPDKLVKSWTSIHESDGTSKGSITSEGRIVEKLEGVYGLSVLTNLTTLLNVDDKSCFAMGRGTLARQYITAIHEQVVVKEKR